MGKAFGYVRVSTAGQVEDGVSLEAQRARLTAWCVANGFDLVEVFVDAGLSGGRADNRPGLQAALDATCRERGVLVVLSLSRLARSTKDTISIAERLDRSGADLVSLSERIDTTSAAGRMVFRMLAVLAEFERDLVSERTASAMAHKRAKGELVGRVPFGFDLAADGVQLVPNAREQRAVEIIAELRGRGWSLRRIADELTARGVPTKSGGSSWTHTAVARIAERNQVAA
jgi:DNA invertase Pin-like site-specific DNA recombinase